MVGNKRALLSNKTAYLYKIYYADDVEFLSDREQAQKMLNDIAEW